MDQSVKELRIGLKMIEKSLDKATAIAAKLTEQDESYHAALSHIEEAALYVMDARRFLKETTRKVRA